MTSRRTLRGLLVAALIPVAHADAQLAVPKYDTYKHYVDHFNVMEDEFVAHLIPNAQAWEWMVRNVPAFECPDKELEEIYYFCLDGVDYHGRTLTLLWDRDGDRYGQGRGLVVVADGRKVAESPDLQRVVARLDGASPTANP